MTKDAAAAKPLPTRRDEFPVLRAITTRWMDNDQYGHVNNVVYYSYFDTVDSEPVLDTSDITMPSTMPSSPLVGS